ncbi:pyridoxamine 5'-phosphate oxidase family protein [Streptomyces seoulensis]|uniref:pyridoxamine 5'-phosphate oxidase family protein n=1 Tax=Streptomyces seoulensis TaxID=73044 RepID=UPI003692A073
MVRLRDENRAGRRHALGRDEALCLLGGVRLGRIVFTRHALPAVRPVHHVLDGGDIVIRVHEGAALVSAARQDELVVAYEADVIDPDTHLGWSVVVTGYAHLVTDVGELARIRLLLAPWAPRQGRDYAVRIRPGLVTGVRLGAPDGILRDD